MAVGTGCSSASLTFSEGSGGVTAVGSKRSPDASNVACSATETARARQSDGFNRDGVALGVMGKRLATILATILTLASVLAFAPAQAQMPWDFLLRSKGLPDAVEFGSRVEMGDTGNVKEWLERGLDPNFVGDRIGTGLMIAAWQGNLEMMALFVAKGADVNKANALGEQALMHAAWRGHLPAVQWLMGKGATLNRSAKLWTALHYAAFSGHEEVVRYLVARGADIDAKSPNGSTPLMMAVYEGKESAAKTLIRLGADRKAVNDRGDAAMDWAFRYERVSIARALGTMEEFAAAANRPKSDWAAPPRSLPATAAPPTPQAVAAAPDPAADMREQIEELTRVRAAMAARKMTKEVAQVDRKIVALRYRLARPGEDYRRPAVLEITAERKAPRSQKARLRAGEAN